MYAFFLSLLFRAASLFCASLLSVLASEVLVGPSCWFDVDGVPLPMAPPLLLPSLLTAAGGLLPSFRGPAGVAVVLDGRLDGGCLDGPAPALFHAVLLVVAPIDSFGAGSTTCIGSEGKMLRV